MKTLKLIVAIAACASLVAPAFAIDRMAPAQSSPQLVSADDFSAAGKKKAAVKSKKKKGGTTGGGGMWGG